MEAQSGGLTEYSRLLHKAVACDCCHLLLPIAKWQSVDGIIKGNVWSKPESAPFEFETCASRGTLAFQVCSGRAPSPVLAGYRHLWLS
jgi:hypothetical protein